MTPMRSALGAQTAKLTPRTPVSTVRKMGAQLFIGIGQGTLAEEVQVEGR